VKKFIQEFKEFALKGNVMDMAVGVIIGGAFTAIVTALTSDIINPLITLLSGGVAGEDGVAIPLTIAGFNIGNFISAIINFLIIALIVFLLVKSLNKAKEAAGKIGKKNEEGEPEPEMNPPACPFCLEEVKEGATRCPHCAGAFDEPAMPTPVEAEEPAAEE
jgi:large conductance mechanosensitive channel